MTRRAAKPIDLTLEREIQADVVELYRRLGCEVVVFTQHGRLGSGTRQTPGIADLKVYCARKDATWWHEVKTPSGAQSSAQIAFQGMVEACGETYVIGGTEPALSQLRLIGVITGRPSSVAP